MVGIAIVIIIFIRTRSAPTNSLATYGALQILLTYLRHASATNEVGRTGVFVYWSSRLELFTCRTDRLTF